MAHRNALTLALQALSARSPLVHVRRLTSVPGRGLIAVRPDGCAGFSCQPAGAGQFGAWPSPAGADSRLCAG